MSFKIGDIIMRMDGDKRPHKIVDITVHYPLNSREHTFFQYHYEDGGSDISDSRYIVPYDGKYKRNKVMKANEAPEKLYIDLFKGEFNVSYSPTNTSVEYTRTDAFIKKAVDWLEDNAIEYWGTEAVDNGMMIEDFRKYMEE